MGVVSDPPILTPMVDASKRITRPWLDYLVGPAPGSALSLAQGIQQAIILPVTPISLRSQGSAILTTPFGLPTLPGGLYRVSYFLKVSQPGTVSSAFQVTFSWTTGGTPLSQAGVSITGNTTGTFRSETMPLLRSDANAPINYAVSYASAGVQAAQFDIDLVIEQL